MCSTFHMYPYWGSHGLLPIIYNADVTAITYCVRDPKPLSSSMIHPKTHRTQKRWDTHDTACCNKKIRNRYSKRKRPDPEKSHGNQTWVSRCPFPAEHQRQHFILLMRCGKYQSLPTRDSHLCGSKVFARSQSEWAETHRQLTLATQSPAPTELKLIVWPRAPGGINHTPTISNPALPKVAGTFLSGSICQRLSG